MRSEFGPPQASAGRPTGQSPAMDERTPAAEQDPRRALIGLVAAACMAGYFAWMVRPLALEVFEGSPPIEQLRRVDGQVRSWRGCHAVGRRSRGENVTLAGSGGDVRVEIPCVLPAGTLSDGRSHRMTVLLHDMPSMGSIAYDIDLDGRKLLAYADVKRDRDAGRRFVMPAIGFLVAVLGLVFGAASWGFIRSLRGSEEPWIDVDPLAVAPSQGSAREAPASDRRAAALAMLASGNSAHAVASVFGVTEAVLAQWAGEPRASVAAPVVASRRPTSFDATLVYETPLWIRATIAVLCLALSLFIVANVAPMLRGGHGAADVLRYSFVLVLGTFGMAIPYRWTRVRLVFGPREIRSHDLFGSQALAYGEVGGFSLERASLSVGGGQRIQGSRLTIVSTGHRPALSTFVYPGRPLDPRMLERLHEVGDQRH